MKKIDLGQAVTVLANVGVIAGIVFLGMELQQNNELLAAQARYNLIVQRADMTDTLREPHVLEAMENWAAGKEMGPGQNYGLRVVAVKLLEMWEWQFNEYRAGMLELDQLPVENWRGVYSREIFGELGVALPVKEVWESDISRSLSSEFTEFMEENVVNER